MKARLVTQLLEAELEPFRRNLPDGVAMAVVLERGTTHSASVRLVFSFEEVAIASAARKLGIRTTRGE